MRFFHQPPGIRPHGIAQPDIGCQYLFIFLPEAPYFIGPARMLMLSAVLSRHSFCRKPVAVKAHHRAEGSPLKPADQQLTKGRILRIPSRKTADIRCPPGNSRNPHIQPRAYLPAEGFPVRVDIPGPDKRPVPLAPGPGTAHQVHRLL